MNGQFYCSLKYAIYWSLFIFMILLDEKNLLFLSFSFFKKGDFYSFGIYLLHMESFAVISYIRNKKFMFQSSIEFVILDIFVCYRLGKLFYFIIENPAMNIGNHFKKE